MATFLDAPYRVVDGGTVLDPEVVSQRMVRRRAEDPMRTLTPREVLGLMAEGHANRAIAERLVVTETAVSKHIRAGHRRGARVLTYLQERQ